MRKYLTENPPYRVFPGGGRFRGPPPLDRTAPPVATVVPVLLRPASHRASLIWEARHSQGWLASNERPPLELLPGYPPQARTPAFRRTFVRTLLAAKDS
jgi:hypothetical protein